MVFVLSNPSELINLGGIAGPGIGLSQVQLSNICALAAEPGPTHIPAID
jgi:hypothetical protein